MIKEIRISFLSLSPALQNARIEVRTDESRWTERSTKADEVRSAFSNSEPDSIKSESCQQLSRYVHGPRLFRYLRNRNRNHNFLI